jgi:hypothetical protein
MTQIDMQKDVRRKIDCFIDMIITCENASYTASNKGRNTQQGLDPATLTDYDETLFNLATTYKDRLIKELQLITEKYNISVVFDEYKKRYVVLPKDVTQVA